MNIRNKIEEYIALYAPNGFETTTEEKSDFTYYLSWPDQVKLHQVTIVLDTIYERELECETDDRRAETLGRVSSYLKKLFINFNSDEEEKTSSLVWNLKTVAVPPPAS
jgi:hypothetical protein